MTESEERHQRHRGRPDRSGGWLGLVVLTTTGVLLLTLAGVLVWAAVFKQSDSKGPQASTAESSSHAGHTGDAGDTSDTASPSASAPQSAVSPLQTKVDPLEACVAEVAAADAEVAEARIGIGHWREHIQARTDLLSGAQPQEVTKAIWKRTREAGPADLTRYDAAVAKHAGSAGACKRATGTSPELKACQQRLGLLDKAVKAGAGGMGDWRAHQKAMAAHKSGELDAAHAQTMWVAAWSAAPKNLNAFTTATKPLQTAPTCR